jgi:tetratricopeptide (TPR) repeat protein
LKRSLGEAEAAMAVIEEGIAAATTTGPLYAALSEMRQSAGDPAGAAEAVQAGLEADPDNPALQFRAARLMESAGDFEAAIAAYEALYARNSSNVLVANNLASLLSDHREDAESIARAVAVARRLRDSNNAAFLDTYGWTLHRAGRHEDAVEILERSTAALSEEPVAQYHLGMALEAAGDPQKARGHLEQALTLAGEGATLPETFAASARAALERLEGQAGQ